MKRIHIDRKDTTDTENSASSEDDECTKSLPWYRIIPSENRPTDSLIKKFRLTRNSGLKLRIRLDSTHKVKKSCSEKSAKIPTVPSASGIANSKVQSPKIVSTDLTKHQEGCMYAHWLRTRSTLLTDDEVREALIANYVNKMVTGGASCSSSYVLSHAKRRSNNDLANGAIRYYLDSQRKALLDSISREMQQCNCAAARIELQEKAISSSASQSEGLTLASNGLAGLSQNPSDSSKRSERMERTDENIRTSFVGTDHKRQDRLAVIEGLNLSSETKGDNMTTM